MSEADHELLLTISQAAYRSGIAEGRLRAAVKAGHLRVVQLGRTQKIMRKELHRYVESLQNPPRLEPQQSATNSPEISPADAHTARLDEIRAALKAAQPYIREAKRFAKLHLRTDNWQELVSANFPRLDSKVIAMLPDAKPSVIAFEHVGQQMFGVSGRQLQRILANKPKNEGSKTDDKNGRHDVTLQETLFLLRFRLS